MSDQRAPVWPVAIIVLVAAAFAETTAPVLAGRLRLIDVARSPHLGLWLLWALAAWPVVRAYERFRGAAVHVIAIAALTAMHIAYSLLVNIALVPREHLLRFILLDRLPRYTPIDAAIYALTIASAIAIRSALELRRRERTEAELDAREARAELELLRMQLNPQHLIDSLHGIADAIKVDERLAEQRIETMSSEVRGVMQVFRERAVIEPPRESPPPRVATFFLAAATGYALLTSILPATIAFVAGRADAEDLVWAFVRLGVLLLYIPLLLAVREWKPAAIILIAIVCACASEITFAYLYTSLATEGARRTLLNVIPRAFMARQAFLAQLFYLAAGAGLIALRYRAAAERAEIDAHRRRATLAETQLGVLRMQIHPHFLFNSLNAIAGVLDQREVAEAMTRRLAQFLATSLSTTDNDQVPLRSELAFLDDYLAIERTRFGERLHVTIDVPEELRDAQVPALVLQPLVENAIRHGIAHRPEGGRVHVIARAQNGMLLLRVENSIAHASTDKPRLGLGLANTRDRLRHMYGDRQQLTFGSGAESFHVELLFPRT